MKRQPKTIKKTAHNVLKLPRQQSLKSNGGFIDSFFYEFFGSKKQT